MLAIGLVVAEIEADQVAQREAVVRDDVVDRFHRLAPVRLQALRRARQRLRELASGDRAAKPERPHGVAETVVPLQPAVGEVAGLVAAGTDIPGLGDQLAVIPEPSQHRVLANGREKRPLPVETQVAASQHRGEVETETVDMHLADPVAQAVHHQLQHAWLPDIEGVAAAAVVLIASTALGRQAVAAGVVQPAPAQRGTGLVAFGTVVEHHVEQHLDAGLVQAAHHAAKLVACIGWVGRQARRRAEKAQSVVAPVVGQAVFDQAPLVQPVMHRQQADRGDAQRLQVGQRRVVAQPGKRAAQRLGHVGVGAGIALDMELADHRVGQPGARRTIVAPVEVIAHGAGLECASSVVALIGL